MKTLALVALKMFGQLQFRLPKNEILWHFIVFVIELVARADVSIVGAIISRNRGTVATNFGQRVVIGVNFQASVYLEFSSDLRISFLRWTDIGR